VIHDGKFISKGSNYELPLGQFALKGGNHRAPTYHSAIQHCTRWMELDISGTNLLSSFSGYIRFFSSWNCLPCQSPTEI